MANINSKTGANAVLAAAAPQYKTSDATKRAYAALQKLTSSKSGVGKSIAQNLKKLTAAGDFDPNKSAYYQQAYRTLKGSYRNMANTNMLDAIAGAAANTQGFGNSYGATAGNRAYQSKMNALAAKVPSLYSAAANEFGAKKEQLANLIALQQAQQQAAIEQAQYMLGTQQKLDAARYDAAKYADNAAREQAKLWWTNYLASQ